MRRSTKSPTIERGIKKPFFFFWPEQQCECKPHRIAAEGQVTAKEERYNGDLSTIIISCHKESKIKNFRNSACKCFVLSNKRTNFCFQPLTQMQWLLMPLCAVLTVTTCWLYTPVPIMYPWIYRGFSGIMDDGLEMKS